MTSNLSPDSAHANTDEQEQFLLRQTNVSSPSVIHSKPSQQSITASEDYYSLSSRSTISTIRVVDDNTLATHTINRYTTPPSRYRTPLQSRDQLPSQSQVNLSANQAQNATEDAATAEMRKTPMRGEGKRRLSNTEPIPASDYAAAGPSIAGGSAALREGGIRRKPVPSTIPSTVMEVPSGAASPRSQEFIDPAGARSSVAQDLDRGGSPITPGNDDTPFIRFALDQLTRDEEVRGSRRYPGQAATASTGAAPLFEGAQFDQHQSTAYQAGIDAQDYAQPEAGPSDDHGGFGKAAEAGAAALGLGAAATAVGVAYSHDQIAPQQPQPTQQWPGRSRRYDELPPRHPRHVYNPSVDRPPQEPDLYIPVEDEAGYYERLNFFPGILRPVQLLLFILLLLVLLALLLASAIWSLTHQGISKYGTFGDSKYFVFEYLPTLLGMVLFIWLVQIEVAVYRMVPFIAMSAPASPQSWEAGSSLPLYPKTWFLPYLGHFAVSGVVGFFMVVAWLQIWTIPFLASAFNAHFFGSAADGQWRWVGTAALLWIVIALYLLLLVATITLFVWLRGKKTGLKWDPRSLADMIVLLEHSNALIITDDDEIRRDPPRLGYWRTSRGNDSVFHTYGIADKPARMYSVRNGRLTEKQPLPAVEPKSRFSDFEDVEMGREQRHSREKMLPRRPSVASSHASSQSSALKRAGGSAIPWVLHPSAALLWIIIAIVLLLAFLIVSYLPATQVDNGFPPMVSAPVNGLGFSYTNFVYSFIPAILAMIVYLGLLDIDYAYRRLQPYASLVDDRGALAEQSLLISYVADAPVSVTASALANAHTRVAALSAASLIAAVIPVLAGGCFWAQFFVPTQTIRIYAHMPAFYALSVFVAVYALVLAACVYPGRSVRAVDTNIPNGNTLTRWRDIIGVLKGSRILDDVQFRAPASKIDLVTRLLSAPAGSPTPAGAGLGRSQEGPAAASKISVADSVRGFGRARQAARMGLGVGEVPRFALGAYTGRDGKEGVGVDRLRA